MKKYFAVLGTLFVFATTAHGQISSFNDGVVVGGTGLSSGLLLDVNGKIGATELCDNVGTQCTTVATIFSTISGSGITGSGSSGYIPRFNGGTNLANSVIRQSGDSNIGIGVAGMANGDAQSSKLRVSGNIKGDGGHLYLRGHDLYSDNSTALYIDSNNSGLNQVILRDSTNAQYGRLRGGPVEIGLMDSAGQWVVRSVNDSYVELRDNNEVTFRAGQGGVSGNYGTVSTLGSGKAGWEGYSINGNEVFMNNAANDQVGLYNDALNRWRIWWDVDDFQIRHSNNELIMHADQNSDTIIYRNGVEKARTTSYGLDVSDDIRANQYCNVGGTRCVNIGTNTTPINAGQDTYGGFTTGTPTDTCNGDNGAAYYCLANEKKTCVDRISGTQTTCTGGYSCGKSGTTCCSFTTTTTNQRRNITCRIERPVVSIENP